MVTDTSNDVAVESKEAQKRTVIEAAISAVAEQEKQRQLLKDIAHARARASDMRKMAPSKFSVGPLYEDEMKRMVKLYAPECCGKEAQWTAKYVREENYRKHVDQGWEPVVVDGRHVRMGELLMCRRPKEFSMRQIMRAAELSKAMITEHDPELRSAHTEGLSSTSEVEITKTRK